VAPVGVAAVAAVSLAVVVTGYGDDELQRSDWRAVAEAVDDGTGVRLVVVNIYGGLSSPLRRYLPGAAPLAAGEPVTAAEVDVVVATPGDRPCNMFVGRPCGMVFLGAPLPPGPADALGPAERVDAGAFAVDRHRPAGPVTLTRDDLLNEPDRADGVVWVVPG
jgi:hypothetical protein